MDETYFLDENDRHFDQVIDNKKKMIAFPESKEDPNEDEDESEQDRFFLPSLLRFKIQV